MPNPYSRGLASADPTYSSFAATAFQTGTPSATGVTTYLAVPFIARNTRGSIYGNTAQFINQTGVNHRAYLFAKEAGTFSFSFPASDDITLLWVGSNAYGPTYARSNAVVEQLYNGAATSYAQQQYTYNVTLTQGQYLPFRVLWGNAAYDGQFSATITAPDGTLVTNGTSGGSPFVVQYSCDNTTAPRWATWGREGTTSTVRRRWDLRDWSSIREWYHMF